MDNRLWPKRLSFKTLQICPVMLGLEDHSYSIPICHCHVLVGLLDGKSQEQGSYTLALRCGVLDLAHTGW